MYKSILCTFTKSPFLVNKYLLCRYCENLILHHLGYLRGFCPPNTMPTFNGPNAIRNIQIIFITKANPLKQIIILMKKSRTILASNGQIPLRME